MIWRLCLDRRIGSTLVCSVQWCAFHEELGCMFKEPVMNDTQNKFHSAQCERVVCAYLPSFDIDEIWKWAMARL